MRRLLAVLALFTIALALRLIFFGGLLGWDDVDFIRAAEALVAGETMPRTSADLRYGFVVPLAITTVLVGPGELSAVLVPLTYWILEFVVAFALGHLLGGFGLGMVAAAIVALTPLDVLAATELHSDLAAGVWMAATMYGVMRGERAAASGVAWLRRRRDLPGRGLAHQGDRARAAPRARRTRALQARDPPAPRSRHSLAELPRVWRRARGRADRRRGVARLADRQPGVSTLR